jgi:hypothetical protein
MINRLFIDISTSSLHFDAVIMNLEGTDEIFSLTGNFLLFSVSLLQIVRVFAIFDISKWFFIEIRDISRPIFFV